MNNNYNERSMKIIDLKKTILEDNDADADRLREELKKTADWQRNTLRMRRRLGRIIRFLRWASSVQTVVCSRLPAWFLTKGGSFCR